MILEIFPHFSMPHEDDDDNDDTYNTCKLVCLRHLEQFLVPELVFNCV